LAVPVEGWTAYLHERNIPVVVDDLGREAIARSDARQLLAEKRENEGRAREMAARQEQQFVEQGDVAAGLSED
jgi:hypothetical protein